MWDENRLRIPWCWEMVSMDKRQAPLETVEQEAYFEIPQSPDAELLRSQMVFPIALVVSLYGLVR